MDIIEKPTIDFYSGDVTREKLQSIVVKENEIIDKLNNILKSFCDINQEVNTRDKFELGAAIKKVPDSRRSATMKIRFIEFKDSSNIRYGEYFYTGPENFTKADWENPSNWTKNIPNIIDGGEW